MGLRRDDDADRVDLAEELAVVVSG